MQQVPHAVWFWTEARFKCSETNSEWRSIDGDVGDDARKYMHDKSLASSEMKKSL